MRYLFKVWLVSLLYQTEALQCKKGDHRDTDSICTLTGVRTNKTHRYFNLTPSDEVKYVSFNNSVMHTFTRQVCDRFPNLHEIHAQALSLEKISVTAFGSCRNLMGIFFDFNFLETLDARLFERNDKLEFISFTYNSLRKVDGRLFQPLIFLEMLFLHNNFLTELPLQDFPELPELKYLKFDYNDITDLDERMLILKFPKLRTVDFSMNLLECDRLKAITFVLDLGRIQYIKGSTTRDRQFPADR